MGCSAFASINVATAAGSRLSPTISGAVGVQKGNTCSNEATALARASGVACDEVLPYASQSARRSR